MDSMIIMRKVVQKANTKAPAAAIKATKFSYAIMAQVAIKELGKEGGSSYRAIRKYIKQTFSCTATQLSKDH